MPRGGSLRRRPRRRVKGVVVVAGDVEAAGGSGAGAGGGLSGGRRAGFARGHRRRSRRHSTRSRGQRAPQATFRRGGSYCRRPRRDAVDAIATFLQRRHPRGRYPDGAADTSPSTVLLPLPFPFQCSRHLPFGRRRYRYPPSHRRRRRRPRRRRRHRCAAASAVLLLLAAGVVGSEGGGGGGVDRGGAPVHRAPVRGGGGAARGRRRGRAAHISGSGSVRVGVRHESRARRICRGAPRLRRRGGRNCNRNCGHVVVVVNHGTGETLRESIPGANATVAGAAK
jgi:hypothetical protein